MYSIFIFDNGARGDVDFSGYPSNDAVNGFIFFHLTGLFGK